MSRTPASQPSQRRERPSGVFSPQQMQSPDDLAQGASDYQASSEVRQAADQASADQTSGGDTLLDDETTRLTARAELLARRLAMQAEAARAEAKRVELEELIDSARDGSIAPLRDFLAKYDPAGGDPTATASLAARAQPNDWTARNTSKETHREGTSAAARHGASEEIDATSSPEPESSISREVADTEVPGIAAEPVVSADAGTAADARCPEGWAKWDSAARRRLAVRRERLQRGQRFRSIVTLAPTELARPTGEDHFGDRLGSPAYKAPAERDRLSDKDNVCHGPGSPSSLAPEPVELANLFAEQSQAIEQQRHQVDNASRYRGIVASVLAHVALVIVLALVTLQMPSPPSGLALESSTFEAPEESFELSEPVDAPQPEEQFTEDLPTPEPQAELSESLSDLSEAVSESLDGAQAEMPTAAMVSTAREATAIGGSDLPGAGAATFYGAAASGNCFCFVIDGSGSMRGGAWGAAKHELLQSLSNLEPRQRFHIVFFNQELSILPAPGNKEPAEHAIYATSENLEHARSWLNTLAIEIGAPPIDALQFAIDLEPDAIYLLTDGETKADVPEFLRRANRVEDLIAGEQVRVPIHTIAYYSPDGREMLTQIAEENCGQYVYVPEPPNR